MNMSVFMLMILHFLIRIRWFRFCDCEADDEVRNGDNDVIDCVVFIQFIYLLRVALLLMMMIVMSSRYSICF